MSLNAYVYGTTRGRSCSCVAGKRADICCPAAAISACALSRLEPAASRPNTFTLGPVRGA